MWCSGRLTSVQIPKTVHIIMLVSQNGGTYISTSERYLFPVYKVGRVGRWPDWTPLTLGENSELMED